MGRWGSTSKNSKYTRYIGLLALGVIAGISSACSSTDDNSKAASPQVGEVWYVQDHAYNDNVYQVIVANGNVDQAPAQTNDKSTDQSYHFIRPYACKIAEAGDLGFFKCNLDSDYQLSVSQVWANKFLNAKEAEAADPGLISHPKIRRSDNTPDFLRIRPGLMVYIGNDGGDSQSAMLCSSIEEFHKFQNSADHYDCHAVSQGISALIKSVHDDYNGIVTSNYDIPMVELQDLNHKTMGFTQSTVEIIPRLPQKINLRIKVDKDVNDKKIDIHLQPKQICGVNEGPILNPHSDIQVINQSESTNGNELYVLVRSGNLKGRHGWIIMSDAETMNGQSLQFS